MTKRRTRMLTTAAASAALVGALWTGTAQAEQPADYSAVTVGAAYLSNEITDESAGTTFTVYQPVTIAEGAVAPGDVEIAIGETQNLACFSSGSVPAGSSAGDYTLRLSCIMLGGPENPRVEHTTVIDGYALNSVATESFQADDNALLDD